MSKVEAIYRCKESEHHMPWDLMTGGGVLLLYLINIIITDYLLISINEGIIF